MLMKLLPKYIFSNFLYICVILKHSHLKAVHVRITLQSCLPGIFSRNSIKTFKNKLKSDFVNSQINVSLLSVEHLFNACMYSFVLPLKSAIFEWVSLPNITIDIYSINCEIEFVNSQLSMANKIFFQSKIQFISQLHS